MTTGAGTDDLADAADPADLEATAETEAAPVTVVWEESFRRYNFGDHPLDPVRVELTMALARELGVLDRPNVTVVGAEPADDALLQLVHESS